MQDQLVSVAANSPLERVTQIHVRFLDSLYAADYYKEFHIRTGRYAKHFDFGIALGAVVSGGSGIGILADPKFAWVCGVLTTASVIIVAAKTTYNWPAKVEFAARNIEFFGRVSGAYQRLVEDLNYARTWNDDFNRRYEAIREENSKAPADPYPALPLDLRGEIQKRIKANADYTKWWRPKI